MEQLHYPYCPHGKYVGGCGADYMCFHCEMGDTLTDAEQAEYERRIAEWQDMTASEQFWSLPSDVLDGP